MLSAVPEQLPFHVTVCCMCSWQTRTPSNFVTIPWLWTEYCNLFGISWLQFISLEYSQCYGWHLLHVFKGRIRIIEKGGWSPFIASWRLSCDHNPFSTLIFIFLVPSSTMLKSTSKLKPIPFYVPFPFFESRESTHILLLDSYHLSEATQDFYRYLDQAGMCVELKIEG